jgi:hypothetical protein
LLTRGDITVIGRLSADFTVGSASLLPGCSGGDGTINNGCNYSSSGGGGGGFASNGARGGDISNNSNPGGAGGTANGNQRLVPLRGGCRGGYVKDGGTILTIRGGGGGGAIQLVSRTRITIDGEVHLAGQQGSTEDYKDQYQNVVISGGGSGGALLLEAPSSASAATRTSTQAVATEPTCAELLASLALCEVWVREQASPQPQGRIQPALQRCVRNPAAAEVA